MCATSPPSCRCRMPGITRKLPAQAATNRAKQIRFRRRKLRNMRPNLPISNFLSKAVIDQFPYLGCGTLAQNQRTCCTEEAEVILSGGTDPNCSITSREATFDSVLRRSGSRPKRRTGFRLATSVRHPGATSGDVTGATNGRPSSRNSIRT